MCLRQYDVFPLPSSQPQEEDLTTRRIVVYPLRELEGEEVLDGVEERRRRDEELPFGQEARRLGKDCGFTVSMPRSRKNAGTYNSRETWCVCRCYVRRV